LIFLNIYKSDVCFNAFKIIDTGNINSCFLYTSLIDTDPLVK